MRLSSLKIHFAVATTAVCLVVATGVSAADFDGDGIADEFTTTRDAAKAATQAGVVVVNPWKNSSAKPAREMGFIVRLSRTAKTYLLHDHDFLSTPAWMEKKPPVETIAKTDKRYRAWKKKVPALKGDAIQLGTEAGIDILLYWNGKQWELFWPDEEP
jgi:hypothetical protein